MADTTTLAGQTVLLFDFDGVIVDSFDISYAAHRHSAPEGKAADLETYRSFFDGNIFDSAPDIEEHLARGGAHKREAGDTFDEVYVPALMELEPVSGMPELIRECGAIHRLAVISSTISSPIGEYLRTHDLFDLFDKVYGGDHHYSKVVKINMAFEDFAVSADNCIFITDTLGDMREAARADVRSIGVTWGFQERATLEQGNPIGIAESPAELASLLERV